MVTADYIQPWDTLGCIPRFSSIVQRKIFSLVQRSLQHRNLHYLKISNQTFSNVFFTLESFLKTKTYGDKHLKYVILKYKRLFLNCYLVWSLLYIIISKQECSGVENSRRSNKRITMNYVNEVRQADVGNQAVFWC